MPHTVSLALIASMFFTTGCSSFGSAPDEDRLKRYEGSAQFNQKERVFQNRRPRYLEETQAKATKFISFFFSRLFGHIDDHHPIAKLPEVKPDFDAFIKPSDELKAMWFGHSTVLLNFDGKLILVDPILSNSLGPFGFTVKRFQESLVKPEDLPKIDYVIITHDHYDHLDRDTMKEFAKRDTQIVTSLGVGSHLESWGSQQRA